MSPGTLLSVNVGLPRDVSWHGKLVHTGIWKAPVDGPRMVRARNVDGDGQGDLNGHGGEQRAVLVYQVESMRHWQHHLGREDIEYGQFGENFTVDGLGDEEVCIGDRYRIGGAEFEVTQPRVTCFRLGMRLGEPALPSLLVAHRRPGFYLRVVTEGRVSAGDEIVRTRRGPHEMSVADVDTLLYLPGRTTERLRAAVDIPALSPGWRSSFQELLSGGDGPGVGVEPGWSGFRELRVAEVVPESSTITSVHLVADGGDPLPPALPGQYVTLRVAGAGDPAPVRSYSLSSAPGATRYRIAVQRDGLVSTYLHTRLRVGDRVEVAAPRGDFVLLPGTGPVVLVSAGVGVTPVLAMLHRLAADGGEREVWWLHTARNAEQQVFADEAQGLLRSLPRGHSLVVHTAGPDAGRLDAATIGALGLPVDATAYVCGPDAFMSDVRDALTELGIASARVHAELFGTLAPINPGVTTVSNTPPHQPAGEPGTGPLVTFARSGLAVRWPGSTSLLALAEACDVPTRWACRSGVCHTCVTPLLSGEVTYQPAPLELPAADQVLVCCSQPSEDVVLDL